MKTTIELPDELFQVVKETAVRRRSSLKDLVIHALEREVAGSPAAHSPSLFDIDELGLPVLHSKKKQPVTLDLVNKLREED